MQRITSDMILRAYRETELKPVQGVWFESHDACGIGVLAVSRASGIHSVATVSLRNRWSVRE